MNRRMSFIMQLARAADEIGWLEHELQLAEISGADLQDQWGRLRSLANSINEIADRLSPVLSKEAV